MRICIILPPSPGLFDQRTNVPLGPLYVAAVLEKAGHDVVLISLLGHDIPATWPQADLYAMGFTTPQADASAGILKLIRSQHPSAKVLAAGAHPTVLPYQTLHLGFDSVLVGEGEKTILDIVSDLPNLYPVYIGAHASLDEVPYPARHLLPHEDLFNEASAVFRDDERAGHIATIMGSRGCPGRCSFCSTDHAPARFRSATNVVGEMKMLANAGIRCFKFQDDTFTLRPSYVKALGEEAASVFDPGEIVTRIITRADTFSPKIIPALRQLNTEVVSLGIESGSQRVLDIARKGIAIERAEHALKLAHDEGFRTFGYFMFGLPGECEETVDETIEFWHRNRPYMDVAVLSIFVPYPGCHIAQSPAFYRVHIINNDWNRYWTVQKRTVIALPYGVSFDKMLELKDKALQAFEELGYARPEWKHDR